MPDLASIIRDGAVVADQWTLILATDDGAAVALPPGSAN